DAGVDVVTAGPHLLEACRFDLPVFALAPDDCVQPDLEEDLPVERPDLMSLFALDDARRLLLQLRRQPTFEHPGWLHEVVAGREERVPDVARLGVGLEPVRLALLPIQLQRHQSRGYAHLTRVSFGDDR